MLVYKAGIYKENTGTEAANFAYILKLRKSLTDHSHAGLMVKPKGRR